MRLSASAFTLSAALTLVLSACSGTGLQKGGLGDDDDNIRGDGGASGGGMTGGSCTPKTCEELDANCGPAADGCGGIVRCGECDENEVCGLHEPFKCGTTTSICELATPSCGERECGLIGDGCDGTFDCGSCKTGEVCGLYEPFKCAAPPTSDPENCPAKITSCASVGKNCGMIGNGCGGAIDCNVESGGCPGNQVCGASAPNVCGNYPACTPQSPAVACVGKCGFVANGCGELIDCDAAGLGCSGTQKCGAGGTPNVCAEPGSQVCTRIPASTACDGKCGRASDGCGGTYVCDASNGGEVCTGEDSCGGGGVPSTCGRPSCTPIDQATACDGLCGRVSDGCASTYDCGGCPGSAVCGFETPNVCGQPVCTPIAANVACDGKCGRVGDGCGGVIVCGASNGGTTCAPGTACGAGGTPNSCGKPACDPSTCEALGFTCGAAPDGCGDVIDCGGTEICGALATCVGDPATCVTSSDSCPLCDAVPECDATTPTAITGRVTTPDGEVGVPNAYVYIVKDNAEALPAIGTGVSGGACERCEDEDLGPVLGSALSDHNGEFTIEGNVPVGVDFTLVVKAGKWRRGALVPAGISSACASRAVPAEYTRLPANSSDGIGANLPRIAISTGRIDEMECVFYKAGIDASEFTVPSESGRIHMYRSNGARMGTGCRCFQGCSAPLGDYALCSGNATQPSCEANPDCVWGPVAECDTETSVPDTNLFASQAAIDAYDLVVFDCESNLLDEAAEADARVREYVNKGGRMFASHWSFSWIYDNGDGADPDGNPWDVGLDRAATWTTDFVAADIDQGYVSIDRPGANASKIQTFARWLDREDAATVTYDAAGDALTGQMSLVDPRDNALTLAAGTEEWMYRTTQNGEDRPHLESDTATQQFSFNTPVGAASDQICGRVAYSAFHVALADNDDSTDYFPCVCDGDTLTPQEKVLLYMLFDLAACISTDGPPPPPSCTPTASTIACDGKCGVVADGCGGTIECNQCPDGQICDDATNTCVTHCDLVACADVGANCGAISDGCGGVVDCGECTENQVCGLYQANVCATPVCTPLRPEDACEGKCGAIADGCGGVLACGGCPDGQVCGAGGPNLCGPGSCQPISCEAQGIACGAAGDGCGAAIECGPCENPGDTCGGGGVPSQCGRPMCEPIACASVGAECGFIGDGCGMAVDCGECPDNRVCGGAGPNKCGGQCQPVSCESENAECGLIGNGCGDLVNCGPCPAGQICGAVEPNRCGPGPSCRPLSCAAVGAECGLIGDGCGQAIDCGDCKPPLACGAAGVANKCGKGDLACVPTTCRAQQAECGAVGDGCGGLLNCGDCPEGSTCGGDGIPYQCSLVIEVGSSRVDLQACKLEYSIVSPK